MKADTPSSVDQSPLGTLGKGRGKGQRRPRKLKGPSGQIPVPALNMGQSPLSQNQQGMAAMQGIQGANSQISHIQSSYPQNPTTMPGQQSGQQFASNQNQQQWYNQQQGFYPQQINNGNLKFKCLFFHIFVFFSVNRLERPSQFNQSKQALSNMLRQRHPLNQFMSQAGTGPPSQPAGYPPIQRHSFPRQPLRQQHPSNIQSNQVKKLLFKFLNL